MQSIASLIQELPAGAVLGLRVAPYHAIRCDHGALWITQDGDPRDVVLGPGDAFWPDRCGLITVSSFQDSTFSVGPRTGRTSERLTALSPFPNSPACELVD